MVVTEIKNAVVDTVEFLIPPFIKLIIALIVANYVTSGIVTQKLNASLTTYLKSLNVAQIKTFIDSLYFTSIVPILAILLLILIAYSINRISSFLGLLVPITYRSTTIIRNPYYMKEIWKYFPQVQTLYELRLKVTHLLSLAKTSNTSLPFEQIKWQEERRQKKFRTLNFLNFLLLWAVGNYIITHKYFLPTLSSHELRVTVLIILLLIVVMYFQVVQNELDIEASELMIVDSFLRNAPEYKKSVDLKELEQIQKLINVEKYYNKRWWSLSIGYRLDWLKMYRYYRPPFYWAYIKWKDRKTIRQSRLPIDK
ncbi:MAG: hypothetical protein WCF67_25155 [Chitinophagaceae bacterium]